jgi:hypothetical protein
MAQEAPARAPNPHPGGELTPPLPHIIRPSPHPPSRSGPTDGRIKRTPCGWVGGGLSPEQGPLLGAPTPRQRQPRGWRCRGVAPEPHLRGQADDRDAPLEVDARPPLPPVPLLSLTRPHTIPYAPTLQPLSAAAPPQPRRSPAAAPPRPRRGPAAAPPQPRRSPAAAPPQPRRSPAAAHLGGQVDDRDACLAGHARHRVGQVGHCRGVAKGLGRAGAHEWNAERSVFGARRGGGQVEAPTWRPPAG